MKHENWTEEDEKRMENIMQRGPACEHYDAIGRDDEEFQRDLKAVGMDIREVRCE